MKPNTTCHFCKKEIYKRPSHIRLYKRHFCNEQCHKEYERITNTKIEVKCSQCQSPIIRTQQRLKRSVSGNHFCNNICKNRFLIVKRWEGKEEIKDRRSIRKKVIKRFGGVCVNCEYNKDKRMLDIHHIDGNHGNNEYSNLWCTCVWCHNLYHRCNIEIKNIIGV